MTSRTSVVNATQRLNYNKDFKGGHSISLMAGHETKAQNERGLAAERTQFYLPENNFSYSLITSSDPASNNDSYHLESYLGRAEYSYQHRYSGSLPRPAGVTSGRWAPPGTSTRKPGSKTRWAAFSAT